MGGRERAAPAGKNGFKLGNAVLTIEKGDEIAGFVCTARGGEVVILYAKVGTQRTQLFFVAAGKNSLAQGGQVFGCVRLLVHIPG
jgi:hypothetical protein